MEFCLVLSECHYLCLHFSRIASVQHFCNLNAQADRNSLQTHWKISLDPSGFQSDSLLLLPCFWMQQWRSPSLGCWAWALSQTQTDIGMMTSKVGLDPWDYSLTGAWECGGNVYKGCREGIESQWSWEAAVVPDHRIWVWQADYSVLQHSEPNHDHHMNFDVFNVVRGWAVVSRTDPFMLSQVFFSWQFYGHK